LQLGWDDLRPVNIGLVGHWHRWIFGSSTALFFLFFFVMVVVGGVGFMGNDWLAREEHVEDKLLIFLICSL
jgi:hypothetical protein